MEHNFVFNDINHALPELCRKVGVYGEEVGSRNGRVRELRHVGVTLTDPLSREIILPGRNANLAAQIAETMWVLAGRNDVKWLENYLPRAKDYSDDGKVWAGGYGPRLRDWHGVDQLAYVVDELRRDRASRRAAMVLWDPARDTEGGKDVPCNNWLSFSSRLGYLDLHVAVRSNDLMWGWSGINVFEWSTLLEIVAGLCGMWVGKLHFSITSLHVYQQHWAKAVKLAQAAPLEPGKDSPRFDGRDRSLGWLDRVIEHWFNTEERVRKGWSPPIDTFSEPMLRSWLHVLDAWWNGPRAIEREIHGTRLHTAFNTGMQSSRSPEATVVQTSKRTLLAGPHNDFVNEVHALHLEKHRAYGDSWKKRGELFSIIPNIARKVDRLAAGRETSDESQTDTAIDLLVYLAKYKSWLTDADEPEIANEVISETAAAWKADEGDDRVWTMQSHLEHLIEAVKNGHRDTSKLVVDKMLTKAYALAFQLWQHDEYKGADHD